MIPMQFQVCPRGREPRWEVTLGNRLYGAYLDKDQAFLDAVDAARCRAGGSRGRSLDPRSIDRSPGLLITKEAEMHVRIRPVLTRERGYAFDSWTPEDGLTRGYVYRRIEDAYYARNFEIRVHGESTAGDLVACATVDEFARSTIGEPEGVLEPVWKNLEKFGPVS